MFKIENDVPAPVGRSDTPAFPFDIMEVGQSFTVPVEMHSRLTAAATKRNKAGEAKFTVRKIGPRKEQTQSRCWRTA